MKKIASMVILGATALLLADCGGEGRFSAWEIILSKSSVFAYLGQFETKTVHPAWIVESETPDEAIVAVGWDTDWRFERACTIKVDKSTNRIYLQRDDLTGEEYWAPVTDAFVPFS